VIVIAIAGLVFGRQATENQIVGQLQGTMGKESAAMIQGMIESANKPAQGILATIIGVITLLAGAAGVFSQMKYMLNTIWDVKPTKVSGIAGIIKSI